MALDVQPVALELKPKLDVSSLSINVSNDYGTPNLLFFYYVPFVPDDREAELDAVQDEFQSWNAWELGQAEVQLLGHVHNGNLPADDSIASRIIRNNYRSKALEVFRSQYQAWLVLASSDRGQKVFDATESSVHSSIRQQLRALAAEKRLQSPFEVILNIVSSSIDLEKENKFFFTHVYYRYDRNSRSFQPVVTDTTFTIRNQNDDKAALRMEINLFQNFYNFDRKFWQDHRHEGEDSIRKGEPIRKEMALNFYVNA